MSSEKDAYGEADDDSLALEGVIAQFEAAWLSGERPEIDGYLSPDGADRCALLVELVHADLECRLKSGEPVRVEAYLERYPELVANQDAAVGLITAEYSLRHRREAGVAAEAYFQRFPQYRDQLQSRWANLSFAAPSDRTWVWLNCPHCRNPTEVPGDPTHPETVCRSCGSTFSISAEPSTTGTLAWIGKFELLDEVGRGAFATVYRARDTQLDRTVAVKLPRSGSLSSDEEEERFLREVRSATQLKHPGIVAVHDYGLSGNVPFIVTEFIDGITLAEAMGERQVGFREAAALVADVAEALEYAHRQGVIHRDVKPSNIMLEWVDDYNSTTDTEGKARAGSPRNRKVSAARAYRPRVMDFGLACRDTGEATVTLEGQVLGTAAYMSPEQARGESHHADARSDIHSLGAVLYELLAGEMPFRGNFRMVLQQVLYEDARPLRQLNDRIPRDLETICLKCLEKDPRRRYASAGQLAEELRRFLEHRPIQARPVSRAERALRWCVRHPALALLSTTVVVVTLVGFAAVTWQWRRAVTEQSMRMRKQAGELMNAAPEAITGILQELTPHREEVAARFRQLLADENIDDQQRLRIRLALLPDDPQQARFLRRLVLHAEPKEILLVRDAMASRPHNRQGEDDLWELLEDNTADEGERFRAALFLANQRGTLRKRWAGHSEFIANFLIASMIRYPRDYPTLLDGLRPARKVLIEPLGELFRDATQPDWRHESANVLAEYASDDLDELLDLVQRADTAQFHVLMPTIERGQHHGPTIDKLSRRIQSGVPSRGRADDNDRRAQQKANAAMALVQLDAAERVWLLLGENEDPTLRSYLVDRFERFGTQPRVLIDRLLVEPEDSIRRALCLSLGAYRPDRVGEHRLKVLSSDLQELFRRHPDPGIHAATGWLLRKWSFGDAVDEIEGDLLGLAPDNRRWYVTLERHTMAILGPAEFWMGSREHEEGRDGRHEFRHRRRINRQFALATCEVTIAQFQKYRRAKDCEPWKSDGRDSPQDNGPVYYVSWSQAASYCNWLSQQAGIKEDQFCYLPREPEQSLDDCDPAELRPAPDFLSRSGYRLPTEAEWEYACRAGTITARFFGESPALLVEYAWCPENSPQGRKSPVGLKKPNDLGLFDMYGNVTEWCHDSFDSYPQRELQIDEGGPAKWESERVIRGMAAGDIVPPRSAVRDRGPFHYGGLAVGFRVARTMAPAGNTSP